MLFQCAEVLAQYRICYRVLRPSQVTGKPARHTQGSLSVFTGFVVACRGFERQVGGNHEMERQVMVQTTLLPSLSSFLPFSLTRQFFSCDFTPLQFFISFSPSCWRFYLNTAGSNWRPGSRIVQTRRLGCRLQAPWGIACYKVPRLLHSILRTWLSLQRSSVNGGKLFQRALSRNETALFK